MRRKTLIPKVVGQGCPVGSSAAAGRGAWPKRTGKRRPVAVHRRPAPRCPVVPATRVGAIPTSSSKDRAPRPSGISACDTPLRQAVAGPIFSSRRKSGKQVVELDR